MAFSVYDPNTNLMEAWTQTNAATASLKYQHMIMMADHQHMQGCASTSTTT